VNDDENIFISLQRLHQIFICENQDGKLLKAFGNTSSGSGEGEFNTPYGFTLNQKYLYVCDHSNERIQILIKTNGKYVTQWGKGLASIEQGGFCSPYYIYKDIDEEIFYVGDLCSVQLFDRTGFCFQRLGDKQEGTSLSQFYVIYGISIMNELYVSDSRNNRIMLFQRPRSSRY